MITMPSVPSFGSTLPPSASPRVEFISLAHLNPSTELNPVPSRGIDLSFFLDYVDRGASLVSMAGALG